MNFVDAYREFATHHLGRPLSVEDGFAPAELEGAELRLGLRLPLALRAWYASCGRREALTQVHNRLLSPAQLEIHDGHLVFLDENQSVCCWGLRLDALDDDDPQVWQGVTVAGSDALEWHSEALPCSQWLCLMGWWQLLNGGFAYAAYTEPSADVVQAVRSNWPLLARHPDGVMTFYGTATQLLATASGETCALWAAGRTRADLQAIDATLAIDWDYSALDED